MQQKERSATKIQGVMKGRQEMKRVAMIQSILNKVESINAKIPSAEEETGPQQKPPEAEPAGALFDSWDTNKDGKLSHGEIKKAMKKEPRFQVVVSADFHWSDLFLQCDTNGNGTISRDEFVTLFSDLMEKKANQLAEEVQSIQESEVKLKEDERIKQKLDEEDEQKREGSQRQEMQERKHQVAEEAARVKALQAKHEEEIATKNAEETAKVKAMQEDALKLQAKHEDEMAAKNVERAAVEMVQELQVQEVVKEKALEAAKEAASAHEAIVVAEAKAAGEAVARKHEEKAIQAANEIEILTGACAQVQQEKLDGERKSQQAQKQLQDEQEKLQMEVDVLSPRSKKMKAEATKADDAKRDAENKLKDLAQKERDLRESAFREKAASERDRQTLEGKLAQLESDRILLQTRLEKHEASLVEKDAKLTESAKSLAAQKEAIREVPVEVIKEVEIIKEVEVISSPQSLIEAMHTVVQMAESDPVASIEEMRSPEGQEQMVAVAELIEHMVREENAALRAEVQRLSPQSSPAAELPHRRGSQEGALFREAEDRGVPVPQVVLNSSSKPRHGFIGQRRADRKELEEEASEPPWKQVLPDKVVERVSIRHTESETDASEAWPRYCCVILKGTGSKEGRIFVEERGGDAKVAARKLTCFGGKREQDELPGECIRRECDEELAWLPRGMVRVCDFYVDNELVAWFYEARGPLEGDQLTFEPGRAGIWVDPNDERMSPWHASVLEARAKNQQRADFWKEGPAPPEEAAASELQDSGVEQPAQAISGTDDVEAAAGGEVVYRSAIVPPLPRGAVTGRLHAMLAASPQRVKRSPPTPRSPTRELQPSPMLRVVPADLQQEPYTPPAIFSDGPGNGFNTPKELVLPTDDVVVGDVARYSLHTPREPLPREQPRGDGSISRTFSPPTYVACQACGSPLREHASPPRGGASQGQIGSPLFHGTASSPATPQPCQPLPRRQSPPRRAGDAGKEPSGYPPGLH